MLCDKVSQGERLGEVIVTSMLESLHALINGAAGGKDKNGSAAAILATSLNQVEPIAVRKTKIDHHRIMSNLKRQDFSASRVCGRIHLVSRFGESLFE
jgi:hypothetical protein